MNRNKLTIPYQTETQFIKIIISYWISFLPKTDPKSNPKINTSVSLVNIVVLQCKAPLRLETRKTILKKRIMQTPD